MAEILFHPSDLNNVHSLKNKLFTGKQELSKLDSLPPSAYQIPKGSWYHGTIEVTWVMSTLPFRIVYSVFLRSISIFLYYAYFEKTAAAIGFQAQTVEKYSNSIVLQLLWGARRIIPSYNSYAPDACYITQFEAIQRENLKDPVIRKHLTPLYDKVSFNQPGGLCSGSVNWFNYLFLLGIDQNSRLSKDCDTYLEYMTAIAKLFKNGQPVQAALLQSLYGIDCPLLGIKEKTFTVPKEQLKSQSDLAESLETLPNGLYHTRIVGFHSLSLLKAPGELLVFDPNAGLLNLETTERLAECIQSYAMTNGDHPLHFSRQVFVRQNFVTRAFRSIWQRVFG